LSESHPSGSATARWDNAAMAVDPGDDPELVAETERYPNGVLKFSGFRRAGALRGAWQRYRTDGSLMRAGAFDCGKQVGTWQTFDRAGRLVKETRFT